MSNAGKLVKDMLKAKKESVMGKLGDSPYEDPMEPWSAKHAQPVKEEVLNEDSLLMKYISSLGFNPEFMSFAQRSSYARSNAFKTYKTGHTFDAKKQNLKKEDVVEGLDSDNFVPHKFGHEFKTFKEKLEKKHGPGNIKYQGDGNVTDAHHKTTGKHLGFIDGEHAEITEQAVAEEKTNHWHDAGVKDATRGARPNPRSIQYKLKANHPDEVYHYMNGYKSVKQGVAEETEQLDEAGTGLLMSFIKSKGLNPLTMDGNQKKAYSRSSEFRIFKMRHMKETSGMGERGDDWNEEKKQVKEEADVKDTVCMDIPLLIRVLEFIREDVKTDVELHNVVERLIDMRHDVPLTMEHYNSITGKLKESKDAGEYDYEGAMAKTLLQTICRNAEALKDMLEDDENLPEWVQSKITKAEDYITTSLDYMKSTEELDEEVEPIEELNKDTLDSYITKVATGPSRGMTQKGTLKSIKAIGGVTTALRKKYEKPIAELKNQDDNQELDSHITREDLRKWFSKTNPEGDWKRINSKGDAVGPCAREPGEPKPKCMSQQTRSELSKSERAAAVATKRKNDPVADRAGKGGKPVNVSNYGKGKLSEDGVDEACWDTHKKVGMKMKGGKMVPDCRPKNEEAEQIDEKNSPTNPALWSRAKSMARSKFDVYPSAYANGWASKWYKSKGGGWKSVSEDTVQEGIGGIEDSPMSATNSVKAMESEHRKKNMKSARIIKSIYKKKGKNESMYDWEKSDKGGKIPTAKIVLQGGTTMTGQPRDTVEIEPVLKTRPNSQKQ